MVFSLDLILYGGDMVVGQRFPMYICLLSFVILHSDSRCDSDKGNSSYGDANTWWNTKSIADFAPI